MNRKGKTVMSRRSALQMGAGLTLGGVLGEASAAVSAGPLKPNVYEALGVKRVINAAGTFTNLGGSLMPPEVVAAWVDASKSFVNLGDLQDKVGARIARLIGVEAAIVTTGAAGAMQLAAAAAITRGDSSFIKRLPDTTGMKHEIILQKEHHSCYDNQLTAVGAKLIEVETPADVMKAVNERTVLMFFMNYVEDSKIKAAQWLELARSFKIPTLIDAAADVPPLERFTEYTKMGFDLVAFSGGKALRGPNDTGLLLGRKDLINAAKKDTNPNCGTIGRALKVSKEDMIAQLAAVERFVKLDHAAEVREWERRIGVIEAALNNIPTVKAARITPAIANHVPHVQVTWDEKKVKITRVEVTKQLADGDPSIIIGRVHGSGEKGILISVFVLQEGEEKIIAERLQAILGLAVR
jgi:L-seryl-tRNA(Ser) seleniumtransferase